MFLKTPKKPTPSILALLVLVFLLSNCTKEKSNKLLIAVSANMQFAAQALVETYAMNQDIEIDIIIGSSGKLTAQISEGAPFDIFMSADMKYPNELFKRGFSKNKPEIYAYGKMILWTTIEDINPSIDILTNERIKHIALANPITAPYGRAAKEILNQIGLLDSLANKFVYGESLNQCNQFIGTQSAEIGFTSMSTILSPNLKNKGKWLAIDENKYKPIEQGVLLINHNEIKGPEALEFYNFLFSESAKDILKNFGYSVNE